MAPSISLLGPPEIQTYTATATAAAATNAIASTTTSASSTAAPSDPFMELMTANFNDTPDIPPMGLTENNSATFLSTGNPCLDFFFHVVPDTPAETLTTRLQSAWDHDPLTALKLVCNLRGVRGTGKNDKEGFYAAALWLHEHHPKTLALNVHSIAEFGCIKDLLEILRRLIYGVDCNKKLTVKRPSKRCRGFSFRFRGSGARKGTSTISRKDRQNAKKKKKKAIPREERLAAEMARLKIEMKNASKLRQKKRAEMAIRVLQRYGRDPQFRFLYDRIADFFAEQLVADLGHLRSGETRKIGLAAKWCPSVDRSYDRSTLLCESIARRVFPRDAKEYAGVEERHYAYRVRDRLRKEVLVPLRKVLELPEVYISANQWDKLPYNRVASVAMKTYKELFQKHDGPRFSEYIFRVKEGKATIAAGALLPHEIVKEVSYLDEEDDVAELQWKRMVNDLAAKGKLKNCVAVCDVSGSMFGEPMEVSVALGLLTSELSEAPWKGNLITFSENPKLHRIQGETLREKADFVKEMDWGMNTDFQKVFDKILSVAVKGKLKEEQMVRRVFVFSDMEFDEASANPWETDYQVIQRKFRESGYGAVVPEIVFWNLRDSMATPVPSTQQGVALVSGFSKNIMTVFLEKDGILNPEDVMVATISGKEYERLAVLD